MKKTTRSLVAMVLAVLMLLGMAACSSTGSESSTGDTAQTQSGAQPQTETQTPSQNETQTSQETFEVVVGASSEPETLDPQLSGASSGGNITYNLFDFLVRMDSTGEEVIPCLATSWDKVDEETWRFSLREGVKFSNGEEFNADDVIYTLDRIFEPDSGRTTYNLKGLSSWEKVDDFTVDLHTSGPVVDMPTRLYDMAILPDEYCASVSEEEFGIHPVGCGPYKLDEWQTNDYISLVANENYWGEASQCTKITFRTIPEISTRLAELMAGTIDIVVDLNPDYVDTVNGYDGYSAVAALSKRVPYIGIDLLNNDSPAELKDVRVRQALNYAIDRDAIIDNLFKGYANKISTIWREDYVGYSDELSGPGNAYPYDPEKAKSLLAEAGYADGFTIDLYYTPAMFLKEEETCLAVASYLEDIGLTVNVIEHEYNALRAELINGQENHLVKGLYGWNWGAKPQTPDGHLAGALESSGITSYYSDAHMDELIAQLRITDGDERVTVAEKLQAYIYEQCPYVFLWQQMDIYGVADRISWTPRLDQYILGTDMKLA